MPAEEGLDETDQRVLAYIKSFDFEAYPWNTEEAAKELGLPPARVYEALSRIQRLRKGQVFVYFRDGALRIQTA